ncbi:DUF4239 domain containing protein [Nitzschia inconspicua]|uniref:DUF4239 domain containing protein n=1 Tax=Nitzschia inconspicua TaxID=303405 RepID=A0A9K3PLX9_9STRA|nr:DUF4239 domain containing protein [Nitzschia inconspicua]
MPESLLQKQRQNQEQKQQRRPFSSISFPLYFSDDNHGSGVKLFRDDALEENNEYVKPNKKEQEVKSESETEPINQKSNNISSIEDSSSLQDPKDIMTIVDSTNIFMTKSPNDGIKAQSQSMSSSSNFSASFRLDGVSSDTNNMTSINATAIASTATSASSSAASVSTTRKTTSSTSASWSSSSSSSPSTTKPKVCESLGIDDQDTDAKSLIESIQYQDDETQISRFLETLLKWTPITIPIFAFVLYDPTALLFSSALQSLSLGNTWVAVDGGQYQARIITPAINGIVVQAIAILFAVLIGNTITNLRQRQTEICSCINQEATQLRILTSLIATYSPQQQFTVQQYLVKYTSRLIAEGHETTNVQALGQASSSQDTELYGLLQLLNSISTISNTNTNNNNDSDDTITTTIPTLVLDKSYETTFRLLDARSRRLTALSSTFPPLHYVVIGVLAFSMCIAFLMETDQDILVFLNAIQLRLLWTSLVGTFCALGVVLYDLGQPFRGSYQVTKAVNQLYAIRSTLKRNVKDLGSTINNNNNKNGVTTTTTTEFSTTNTSGWDPPKAPTRKESVNGSEVTTRTQQ